MTTDAQSYYLFDQLVSEEWVKLEDLASLCKEAAKNLAICEWIS